MQPVMQQLDERNISYAVLADGTAKKLLNGNNHLIPLPAQWATLYARHKTLGAYSVLLWQKAIKSPTAVVGLVSDFQVSVAQQFKQAHANVVGYFDGFSSRSSYPVVEKFKAVLTSLMVPSLQVQQYFQSQWSIPVKRVGQPILETVSKTIQQTDQAALTAQLDMNPAYKTVLFVGGYGQGYPEAFTQFVKSAQQLGKANIMVSLHPKAHGTLEKQILNQWDTNHRIRIAPKAISTDALLAIADGVVSHQSTVNTVAALNNKPVMFVGQSTQANASQDIPLIEMLGVSPRFSEVNSTSDAINQWLSRSDETRANRSELIYQQLGLPPDATRCIVSYVLQLSGDKATPSKVVQLKSANSDTIAS